MKLKWKIIKAHFSSQSEKNLLPHPYKSNCTDYDKAWKKNGGEGPVTEKVSVLFRWFMTTFNLKLTRKILIGCRLSYLVQFRTTLVCVRVVLRSWSGKLIKVVEMG